MKYVIPKEDVNFINYRKEKLEIHNSSQNFSITDQEIEKEIGNSVTRE